MMPNTDKHHRNYLQVQVQMSICGILVKQFVGQMIELNGNTSLMPCQKDMEGSPDQLKHTAKLFTDMQMCMNILRAIPYALATAYWANKGMYHFLDYVKTMADNLALIEPKHKQK